MPSRRSTRFITPDGLTHSPRISRAVSSPVACLASSSPTCENVEQEAAFGAPQSALGINENVHSVERWHQRLSRMPA